MVSCNQRGKEQKLMKKQNIDEHGNWVRILIMHQSGSGTTSVFPAKLSSALDQHDARVPKTPETNGDGRYT